MTATYKHIRFEEIQGFTVCRSNHGSAVLGRVEWMARWKEYEFIPEPDTAYTVECLRDPTDFVGKMNAARKANETGVGRPAAGRTTPPAGSHFYPLFDHMSSEHGLTLTDSELHEIACVVEHMADANARNQGQPPNGENHE